MAERPRHHKPLQKRFNVAMTEEAYGQLRALAEETGLGNNYVLTVLLENAPSTIDKRGFRAAVKRLMETHCRS